jgi:hypothetical protein
MERKSGSGARSETAHFVASCMNTPVIVIDETVIVGFVRLKLMPLSRRQMVYNCCVVQLRNFVCHGMALFILSVPILACALPGQQMSEEEQTCCLHMADECNGSQMGESHSCCNKLPQIGASALQVTNRYAPITLDFAVQVAPDLQPNVATVVAAVLPRMTVLPESPPGQPPVLRI